MSTERIAKIQTGSSAATFTSETFCAGSERRCMITHQVSNGDETGTWTLEVSGDDGTTWETVTAASAEFNNPAAAAATGVANLKDVPMGLLRVVYTVSSGGAAASLYLKVHVQ